nr:tigger transposable element-derived protein 6-like [Rhipicephalus microplus]
MAPTKRKAVSLETKSNILQDLRRGFKVSALVKKYELAQSTISTILKTGSTALLKAGTSGHADERKRVQGPLYADVEEALYQWFLSIRAQNVPISGPILATKVKNLAFLLGRPNFEPGDGWIQRFKERHGIVYKNVVGEAASLDSEAKRQWLQTNLPVLMERFSARDIYNCDETALFFQMTPSKTHALKGDPCPGGKHSKVRVTVLLCVNMDGRYRLKPFDFLTADSAASFCDELTNEAIVADVLSRQAAALCDGSDSSDEEVDSASTTPSMTTQGALMSIDSLIDFMRIKGMPPEFSQHLEAMRTAVVKLKLPRKQLQISDYFGVPNP